MDSLSLMNKCNRKQCYSKYMDILYYNMLKGDLFLKIIQFDENKIRFSTYSITTLCGRVSRARRVFQVFIFIFVHNN